MGAGVAAVAGIDNEPSSCCTAIEEAQAELRQELAGRNERRRELEFLEKGGDPLEFKLVENSAALWSFSQTDSFSKNILSSDGKFSCFSKEDKQGFILDDCSELKRARSATGKFLVDCGPTPVNLISDTIPTIHDKRKAVEVCKSNRTAVKGQYARRNRQRSNRFGNGCAILLEPEKAEGDDGSLKYTSGLREFLLHESKVKDAFKEEAAQVAVHHDAIHFLDASDKGRLKDAQEKVSVSQASQILDTENHLKVDEQSKFIQSVSVATAKEEAMELPLKDEKTRSSMPCNAETIISVVRESGTTSSIEEDIQISDKPLDEIENTEKSMETRLEEGSLHPLDGDNHNENHQVMKDVQKSNSFLLSKGKATHEETEEVERGGEKSNPTDVNVDLMVESHIFSDRTAVVCSSPSKNQIDSSGFAEKVEKIENIKTEVEEEMSEAVGVSVSIENPVKLMAPLGKSPLHEKDENAGSSHDVTDDLQISRNGTSTDKISDIIMVEKEKTEVKTLKADANLLKDNSSVVNERHDKVTERRKSSSQQCIEFMKEKTVEEPPRRKSHWDFVLEEMSWLANDFMQERLWKIAAAAQVARWVAREKQLTEFDKMETEKKQRRIAQSLARKVISFWQSSETLLKESVKNNNNAVDFLSNEKSSPLAEDEDQAAPMASEWRISRKKSLLLQDYAIRFLKDSAGPQALSQAEAPPTPDRVSESTFVEFWEKQFPEESLFYTVPEHAMEVYCNSIVSQWEREFEQRLQEQETVLTEVEGHATGESVDYMTGISPLISPVVTGKRSLGFHGVSHSNVGNVPVKRMRTSAIAARQRAAVAGPMMSGSAAHLARSDISSCDTTSQQDEMTNILEGSSVSGRVTDADSNVALLRSNIVADGVDSPIKSKKKKKARPWSVRHVPSALYDGRESELSWQNNASEQKEHLRNKGEQISHVGTASPGIEGFGMLHGLGSVMNGGKLVKHISNRDRGKKYKSGKASVSQSGFGIPWSPIEDQAILGLAYELGSNWELVSDILSSNSQLKGIFRKPKDCRERHRFLTERLGGDGGDSSDDPSLSSHLPMSLTQKGGTRFLPQHLEETLKNHVDCILRLHQQIRDRKLQSESQERKQLVPEHESHASKHAGFPAVALTPSELCDQAMESGSHPYSLQSAHGMSNMSSGTGMRLNLSAMSVLHGTNNLQLSPSMPSSAVTASATRDAHRMGTSLRPLTAEHRMGYNRMVAGRGMQNQGISATAGLPLISLPNSVESAVTSTVSPGNSAGLVTGLNRGVSMARNKIPGMGPIGGQNFTGVNNMVQPAVGMSLSAAGNASSMNLMRRPRDTMSMGSMQSAVHNTNNNLASSPNQGVSGQTAQKQPQLMQHNTLQVQQHSPGSGQQQSYNMMRVAKDHHQLQQQDSPKRLQQQQPSTSANCSSQSPLASSQTFSVTQPQHVLSPHSHMFPQPSHLLMQPHALPQESGVKQHSVTAPPSAVSTSMSSTGQSVSSRNTQQLDVLPQPVSVSSTSTLMPIPSKHQHPNSSMKQSHQQQGKGLKALGRGTLVQGQSNIPTNQLSTQPQIGHGQLMVPTQGIGSTLGQQSSASPQTVVQNLPTLSQVPDAMVQQYQQKGLNVSGKQMSSSLHTSIPASTPIQHTTSPQQESPVAVAVASTQQQQTRPNLSHQQISQQGQLNASFGTQLASHSAKSTMQPRTMSSSSATASLVGSMPQASPNPGSGNLSSAQWKPGQSFSPMVGLYNLSRANNGAPQGAQLPLPISMLTASPNGNVSTSTSNLISQESRGEVQPAAVHAGVLSQQASVNANQSVKGVPAPHHAVSSSQRLPHQQQVGSQLTSTSSGTAPGPE